MLHCRICQLEHDLETAPDTGECQYCGGQLVEDITESAGQFERAVVEVVNDGFAKMYAARGKAPKGLN